MDIYKVFRPEEWAALERDGKTRGAPIDLHDGYIHFSTAAQLPGTLAKHFAGEERLILATVEAEALGPALRWEPARGGALFPHYYGALKRAEVVQAQVLVLNDGVHEMSGDTL